MAGRLILVLWVLFSARWSLAQYNWPTTPFDAQHWINGTFCENRPSGATLRDHFHDGIDISLSQGNPVYSVVDGTVTSLARGGTNAYIRVGRYAYVHVEPAPNLQVGDPVKAFETVVGLTNSQNHIHFKDGYPGSVINPMRPGALSPFNDVLTPRVMSVEFFVHGSETRFDNRTVFGPVDIVARAMDVTDSGPLGSNNGVYSIGYQILSGDGTSSLIGPRTSFQFDQKPSDQYVTNVYAPGSDLSTYRYQITNEVTRKGYWDTSTLATGDYLVKVFVEDTRGNTDTSATRVTVAVSDTIPPAQPLLTRIVGDSAGSFSIHWRANVEPDLQGYRVYYSFNGDTWTERFDEAELGPADTLVAFNGFPAGTDVYFRITAVDDAPIPNESVASDGYGLQIAAAHPKALIVDGFDRTDGDWQLPRHDFVVPYGLALGAGGIGFDVSTDEEVAQGGISLEDYDLVVYLLGDEETPDTVFTAAERSSLRRYLGDGGALLVSGTHVARDLSQADRTFLNDVLKVGYKEERGELGRVYGVSGGPFQGLEADLSSGAYRVSSADVLDPLHSQAAIQSDDGDIVGSVYQGPVSEGLAAARIIVWSFPFEIIQPPETRDGLMQNALSFFFPTTDVAGSRSSQPAIAMELFPNSPNPFNQETEFRYRLSHASEVTLSVYNAKGQLVQTLSHGLFPAGLHSVRWRGKNDEGAPVASGVYFVKLSSERTELTRPLVLLR